MTYDHALWMAHSKRSDAAAEASDAHAFAVEHIRGSIEQGWSLASLLNVNGGGAGPGYGYREQHGRLTVHHIGPGSWEATRCEFVFSVRRLYDEACAQITGEGKPHQVSLWDSEVAG